MPTIIFSALIIWISLRTEGCFGLADVILRLLLFGLLGLILLVTLTVHVIKIIRKQDVRTRMVVISICLTLTALAITATCLPKDFFQSNPIVIAKMMVHDTAIGNLVLRQDNTYTANRKALDFGCFYSGYYKISNDTLYLETKIIEQTDSLFSTKYLIKNDNYMLPLDRPDYLTDTTYWMKIEK